MTAGERLRQIAGVGGTAAALLLVIGTGVTAGAALVDYSGLPSGTAAVHLMTDVAPLPPIPPVITDTSGGSWQSPRRKKHDRKRDENALLLTGLI